MKLPKNFKYFIIFIIFLVIEFTIFPGLNPINYVLSIIMTPEFRYIKIDNIKAWEQDDYCYIKIDFRLNSAYFGSRVSDSNPYCKMNLFIAGNGSPKIHNGINLKEKFLVKYRSTVTFKIKKDIIKFAKGNCYTVLSITIDISSFQDFRVDGIFSLEVKENKIEIKTYGGLKR